LEDLSGEVVRGYRAPSFSVCPGLFQALDRAGYQYDSSYNSFALHKRYGKLEVQSFAQTGVAYQISQFLLELPVSNLALWGKILPWAGGGYFRLFPKTIFQWGVRRILDQDQTYVFYMHPWEVDVYQPRVRGLKAGSRWKHYVNLHKTSDRLSSLLHRFHDFRFLPCWQYLQGLEMQQTGRV